jgi:hypothetical protein
MEEIMQTKPFLNAVMAALIAVIFSALTGCAGVGAATGGAASDPAAAKRLAANINAVKAGSAKADGGTVALSGEVWLETGLTVSAGVTLDLTADGVRLGLNDGAVLTVNGTVNAAGNSGQGGLHIGDGTTVINGSGTIYLKSKGYLLNIWGDKKHLTLDGVTLVGLPDNDQSLVGIGGSSTLVMKSGAITGNTLIGDEYANGGGVSIGEGGVFTVEGGAITGNNAQGGRNGNGGGVRISKGAFTMKSGEISGNTAQGGTGSGRGGGVDMWMGTFTMSGGTIMGNSAKYAGGIHIGGSTFIMEGGTIYGSSEGVNANTSSIGAAFNVADGGTAKWGTGGTYTKGGVSQTGGSVIGSTDDTLIAIPAK